MATKQLPIVLVRGKRMYRDDRLREFRAVDDPHDRLAFDDYGGYLAPNEGLGCEACGSQLEGRGERTQYECYNPDCSDAATCERITSCCLREPEGDACPECGARIEATPRDRVWALVSKNRAWFADHHTMNSGCASKDACARDPCAYKESHREEHDFIVAVLDLVPDPGDAPAS